MARGKNSAETTVVEDFVLFWRRSPNLCPPNAVCVWNFNCKQHVVCKERCYFNFRNLLQSLFIPICPSAWSHGFVFSVPTLLQPSLKKLWYGSTFDVRPLLPSTDTTLWPKFHLARHGTSRQDSTCSTYCSNMADDEQAIVLACTSLVVFMLLHAQILFVPSNEIN